MSNLTLIIGNKNYSSWSLRPWVFLRQKQIEFNEIRVALFTQTSDIELAEYNSDSKVPVLKDGDYVIWDSLSILEYIAEKYPQANGWPADPEARAFARSMSCEMHASFSAVRQELPMNCRKQFKNIKLSADAEREIERIKQLWRQSRSRFGAQGEWLFGDYSIADAMFAPVALRFAGYGISLHGSEADYVSSVLNQPCIIDWIAAGKKEKEVIEEDEIDV